MATVQQQFDADILSMIGESASHGGSGLALGDVVKSVKIKSMDRPLWASVMAGRGITPAMRIALAACLQQANAHDVKVGGTISAKDVNLIAGGLARVTKTHINKDASNPYTYLSYGSAMGCLHYLTIDNAKRRGVDPKTIKMIENTKARYALVSQVIEFGY